MLSLSKLKEIVEAWAISVKPTEEQKKRAVHRYTICKGCDYNKSVPVLGEVCHKCSCPLDKKIFSTKKGACDIGKWNKVDGI